MKTHELITVLSRNVEPVDRRQVMREMAAAVAIGTMVAIGIVLAYRGIRPDLDGLHVQGFLLLKLAFAVAVVISATFCLVKFARPGGEMSTRLTPTAWPFIGIAFLAATSFVFAPLWHLRTTVMGDRWLECLISIPLIAVLPFALVIWTLRRMAPTDLTRTGALAGLVAGGMGAIGYALHCTDDSLPFIALWYGSAIALCTLAGAVLGSRLLRW